MNQYPGQPNYSLYRYPLRELRSQSGLLVYPTEAVWGLGCDPWDNLALARLLQLKNRPWHKGLIVVTGNAQYFEPEISALPADIAHELRFNWPFATSLLMPDPLNRFTQLVKGQHSKVVLRVCQHPFVQWYTQNVFPYLISTSANRATKSPVKYVWQAHKRFSDHVSFIMPGRTLGKKTPSRILDPMTQQVIRS